MSRAFEVAHADLMIVMGTSLMVAPFNSLVYMVTKGVPMVLVNRDNIEHFDFDKPEDKRVFLGGDCDESIKALCKAAGWEADLQAVIDKYNAEKKS